MPRSNRAKRIDYKLYAATGERVELNVSDIDTLFGNLKLDESMSNDADIKKLLVEESSLYDDINDFLDEYNPYAFAKNMIELNLTSDKMEILRSRYRQKHKELQVAMPGYAERFTKSYNTTLESMKDYVKEIRGFKQELHSSDEKRQVTETHIAEQKYKFHVSEIERMMKEMKHTINVDIQKVTDKELKKRNEDQIYLQKEMRHIGDKIQESIKHSSQAMCAVDTEQLKNDFDQLNDLKKSYQQQLKSEADRRELEKVEAFETSNLNIKLSKFKGYASPMDIYTFQDTVEKLHLKSTPKHLFPDLLKNNYLENPALSIVKHINDIDEIWQRLKDAYGDSKTMLAKKLSQLNNMEALWRLRDAGKIAEAIMKIINCMKDLIHLSKRHGIENHLFYGDGLNKIHKLLGEKRITRWLSIRCEQDWEGEVLWNKLIEFLERDVKVNQQKALIVDEKRITTKEGSKNYHTNNDMINSSSNTDLCHICGATDHIKTNGPGGSKIVQYFACKKFDEMKPAERFAELRKKGLCYQCLYPGAKRNYGRHRKGHCQHDFICKHQSNEQYPTKMHILVCQDHAADNEDMLQIYRDRCILRQPSDMPSYSKNIKLSFHSSTTDCDEQAIYMLQPVKVNGKIFTIFYDSGCGDFVSRISAVKRIGKHASKEFDGPLKLGGVGGIVTETRHGIYSVKLPLSNGNNAVMTGVCIDEITQEFPMYPLHGKVIQDIKAGYMQIGGNASDLPNIPEAVGGRIDFMIGIKYLRYFQDQVFQLPSGLTIYRSKFKNPDGSCGIIGEPHEIFTDIERHHHLCKSNMSSFLTNQMKLYEYGFQINPDATLSNKHNNYQYDVFNEQTYDNDVNEEEESSTFKNILLTRKMKLFENYETAGSEIQYRCVNCRDCVNCKNNEHELLSIKEEVEQDYIERSVKIEKGIVTARLPFIHNPTSKLQQNRHRAMKVFDQQIKKLNRHEKDKEEVLQSEMKLQLLGHVDFVKNLPVNIQDALKNNEVQNYIPWRAVWKESSLSTPCRMVFDASQPTGSGYSLNDILCKGRNTMNKLVEVFIRWRSNRIGLHSDVAKMYNSVKLDEKDWCYQRYLWKENLDNDKPIEEKVIKTLIYGIKSSGNQAESGLRRLAEMSKDEYPEVYEIVRKNTYVDDCLAGEDNENLALKRSDELDIVLSRGGFKLKGITITGKNPSKELSADGRTINVAGLIWEPLNDLICLDIKNLNFAKKLRGKTVKVISTVPEKLTRRHCTAKLAEVYDLTGIFTPIIASMKLDLHELVTLKLGWNDAIPDSMRSIWINHFEMMSEIKNVKFKRAVIPEDAVSLDVNTLGFGDASKDLICVAVYARYKRKNGDYSCQLVFARSRLVPDGMSLPRAELYAALVNTHSSEVVRRSFYQYHTSSIKFTDSQIALHWITNDNKLLKQWVRNCVIEIIRFTDRTEWRYIQSKEMVADIGTRRGSILQDVDPNSIWINCFEWMKLEPDNFPSWTSDELSLTLKEVSEVKKESTFQFDMTYIQRCVPDEVQERYKFSRYVLDPNRFCFRKVVRILALVLKFIKILKRKIIKGELKERFKETEEVNLKDAEKYYYQEATNEIKHFMKPNQYEKFTKEKDGILLYTGRILQTDEITVVGKFTASMKDLSADTFCVPVIEKFSPIAYSIINDIHWYDDNVKHTGIETTWRQVLKKAYIIEGRNIAKTIKKSCQRCRLLEKKRIEVAMGPVSTSNLTIAPCFYNTQVDICGPFEAYSHHQKRTTIKVWMVVFCCSTTSATDIKIMEDYSSTAFIQAFIRFSCTFGYPTQLYSDEGSQIIKAFQVMELNFLDIKQQLFTNVGIKYYTCPVGGHNMNGKVERKIREIRSSLEKNLCNNRLSIMQWETLASEIANCINNRLLALGGIVSDFETMDLLTPNRLILGRNNDRSPAGTMNVSSDPKRIFKSNKAVFESWFENWLVNHVPKLMSHPKWFNTDDICVGDVILFMKNESSLASTYQYGIVNSVIISKDGRIRKAEIKYRNHNETVFRYTSRAIRELIIIHHVDEIGILGELSEMES